MVRESQDERSRPSYLPRAGLLEGAWATSEVELLAHGSRGSRQQQRRLSSMLLDQEQIPTGTAYAHEDARFTVTGIREGYSVMQRLHRHEH